MKDKKHIRFQWVAVGTGVIILGLKFLAYLLTNSNTIFSDAMESIVNVVAGTFALYSLILAAKPKDRDHPYGHGKIEFISAGIEGTLILIAGIGIVYKSVEGLITEHQLMELDTGMWLAGGAGAINFVLGIITENYGKKYKSPTMVASGKHLKSDGYTSFGMIIGLGIVLLTGYAWIDSAIALGFGVFIGFIGIKEIRKSFAGIMDEADFDLLKQLITELNLNRTENLIDLHNFRAQKFGKNIHIDCHITVPSYLTVEEAHVEIETAEQIVKGSNPEGVEMFIHTDPCAPSSCRICSKSSCSIRSTENQERIEWTLDNVLANRKHE
ncbi:MAG: cation diffusion facilitator family transporter [Bacteroidia bacterium]